MTKCQRERLPHLIVQHLGTIPGPGDLWSRLSLHGAGENDSVPIPHFLIFQFLHKHRGSLTKTTHTHTHMLLLDKQQKNDSKSNVDSHHTG